MCTVYTVFTVFTVCMYYMYCMYFMYCVYTVYCMYCTSSKYTQLINCNLPVSAHKSLNILHVNVLHHIFTFSHTANVVLSNNNTQCNTSPFSDWTSLGTMIQITIISLVNLIDQ